MFKLFRRKEQTPELDEELVLDIASEIAALSLTLYHDSSNPEKAVNDAMDVVFSYLRTFPIFIEPSKAFERAKCIEQYTQLRERKFSDERLLKSFTNRVYHRIKNLSDAEYKLYNLDPLPDRHSI